MYQLTIPLEENTGLPLYMQICEHIRAEMKSGAIPAYTRLPSTRKLAATLAVSRSTVQLAYDQLLAEGYLEAEPCRGYYVADMEGALPFAGMGHGRGGETEEPGEAGACRGEEDPEDNGGEALSSIRGDGRSSCGAAGEGQGSVMICDFSPAGVDLSCFPYKTWRRLTKEVFSDETGRILSRGMSQGEPGLRQAISEYLHGARGVHCEPEQVVVGAGNEYLLMLLSQILGKREPVAMENPTYFQAYRVLTALGHEIVPVPLDGQGMRADLLFKSEARLAYVMPSHQYPTGVVMPIARRMELLSWAGKRDGYLIEDDYDSEFRYRGRPVPALGSVDRQGRVIYLGTFSRAIAPAIRVSFLVLPGELLRRYRAVCGFYACTVPRADQEVLARFLNSGSFERHLNRMRNVYREKKEKLSDLLCPLAPDFRIHGDEAGVHILISSEADMSEEEMVIRAREKGVRVYGLSHHDIGSGAVRRNRGTVIAGFAQLHLAQMEAGARALIQAWKPQPVRR